LPATLDELILESLADGSQNQGKKQLGIDERKLQRYVQGDLTRSEADFVERRLRRDRGLRKQVDSIRERLERGDLGRKRTSAAVTYDPERDGVAPPPPRPQPQPPSPPTASGTQRPPAANAQRPPAANLAAAAPAPVQPPALPLEVQIDQLRQQVQILTLIIVPALLIAIGVTLFMISRS
jgi:anti-sigma factor RsiW